MLKQRNVKDKVLDEDRPSALLAMAHRLEMLHALAPLEHC